jgi:hypothetical protein
MKRAFLLVLAACGSDPDPVQPGPATGPVMIDGGMTPDAMDPGTPSTTYPAFTPYIGQLANQGGPVLKKPEIVTVTWNSDPNAATFEQFGDVIGASQYWKAVTSEYGVDLAVSRAANHVRITTAAPKSLSETDIETFIGSRVTTAGSGWPAPTENSVYILYIPAQTQVLLEGQETCGQGVGGYHSDISAGGRSLAYAVVPQCGDVNDSTLSASHELAEAATDPYPQTKPAFSGFKPEHLAWDVFQTFESENGDACEFYQDAFLGAGETDLPFAVQRQWSNARGAAGHHPCVPAPAVPYFNIAPLQMEDFTADLSSIGGGRSKTKGYVVGLGETKSISLGFYSDQARSPWRITAIEGGIVPLLGDNGSVSLTLDRTMGQNGEKANLTIKVNKRGVTKTELISIVSNDGQEEPHYLPILIGTP